MYFHAIKPIFDMISLCCKVFSIVLLIFFAIDLVLGCLLLAFLKRKRHLFWILPPLNVMIWFLVTRFLFGVPLDDVVAAMWVDGLGILVSIPAVGMAGATLLLGQIAIREYRRYRAKPMKLIELPEQFNRPPRTDSSSAAFFEGLTTPWDGFAFLCRNPLLWRYGVIPILIDIVLTLLVLGGMILVAAIGAFYVHDQFPDGVWWRILETLVIVLLFSLTLAFTLATWMLLEGILCGYYHGRLARGIEISLGTPENELQEISFSGQVQDTLRDVSIVIGLNGLLLLLHLIPGIGSIASVILGWYFNAFWMGMNCLSTPMSLRGMSRKRQSEACRNTREQAFGLGTASILLHFLPVVGSILLTSATAGAVLLYRRIRLHEEA